MTNRDDEVDLRDRFAVLRAADSELDPGYEVIREARQPAVRRARSATRAALFAGAAAAAGLAILLVAPEEPGPPSSPNAQARQTMNMRFAPGQWSMPSDALLDLSGVPGDALLREPLSLGTSARFEPPAPRETPPGAQSPAPQSRRPVV